jgi:capsule biosynthesis phosphatase
MKIVIDLDGTICPVKKKEESYADLKPFPGAKEKIQQLRAAGHYVIIQTARNMETCQSCIGKVIKNIGKITLEWLDKYGIEYDEIYFGKPNAEIYIDDRAFRFNDWHSIEEKGLREMAKEK